MSSDTRTLKVIISGDSSGAKNAFKDASSAASHSTSMFASAGGELLKWGTRLGVAVGAVGVAAATLGFTTASGMEQAKIAFTNMLGSGQKASTFLKDLQAFANATPFEFPDLVKSSQQMLAMGFNAKDVLPTLRAIGDAVAAQGGNAESVQRVSRAFGQMQAKGKVAGDEIMQLTEQGIPAIRILADGYGVTTYQMSKMIASGKVLAEKALPMLTAGLENGTKSTKAFGGMMDQQSQTVQGKWSTLVDTVQMGLGQLVSSVFPSISSGLSGVTTGATAFVQALLGTDEPIQRSGESAKQFALRAEEGAPKLEGFAGMAQSAALKIRELGGWLKDTAVPWLIKLKDAASNVAAGFLTVLMPAFDKLKPVLAGALGAIIPLVDWLSKHEAIAKLLGIAIGVWVLAMGTANVAIALHKALVFGTSGELLKWLKGIKLVTAAKYIWAAAIWLVNGAMAVLTSPITLVVVAVALLAAGVVYAYQKFDWFRSGVAIAWSLIKNTFITMVQIVANIFLGFVGMILNGAASAFGWIPGIGPKLKAAAAGFNTFRDNVNNSLNGLKDKQINVGISFGKGLEGYKGKAADNLVFAQGGRVPGIGRGDTVPAMLEPEEFVVRRDGSNLSDAMAFFGAKGHALGGVVSTATRGLIDYKNRIHIQAAGNHFLPNLSDLLAGTGGSGVNRWAALVLQVLSLLGQPAALVGSVLRRINLESGGNPRAINLTDSNARAGHPSQGLMQTIPGTFSAYAGSFAGRGILDPLANIYAGLNYAMHRYGSIAAIDPRVRPFGYDEGGMLPPGLSMAYNGTGKPEPVGGGGVIVYVTVEGNVTTEHDLARAITLSVRDELKKHAGRNGGRTGL